MYKAYVGAIHSFAYNEMKFDEKNINFQFYCQFVENDWVAHISMLNEKVNWPESTQTVVSFDAITIEISMTEE